MTFLSRYSQATGTPEMLRFACVILTLVMVPSWARGDDGREVVDIGSRRELFVDDLLIGEFKGTRRKLHEPQKMPRDAYPTRPSGHYATVLQDGDLFRLYYRGDTIPGAHWRDGWFRYHEQEVTLYAESQDGYHWTLPDLMLHDVESFPEGNVVIHEDVVVSHNFSPFIDTRPGVPEDERYKALAGLNYPDRDPDWAGYRHPRERQEMTEQYGPGGLRAYTSGDGIHWRKLHPDPVFDQGGFDSQNVSFWSEPEQQYVCYFRLMDNGVRSIGRTTSQDFLEWTDPIVMEANEPGEHLYTSGTHPYFRAPHLYIALATRFQTRRSGITDITFMSTRPGSDHYDRTFKEALIRPGPGPGGWGNRANYVAWHVVPTSDTEMSMYMYGGGHYVLRYDGFISIHAGYETGEFVTRPFRFTGNQLEVNYSTSAAGGVHVEIQDAQGQPLDGYRLEDSDLLYGDEISRTVTWDGKPEVGQLAGKPVRLRFVMNEADIYSLRFQK